MPIHQLGCINWGQPRYFNTADSSLQHLEQRHEIPNSKDVLLHKQLQCFEAINFAVDAMVDQLVSEWGQTLFHLFD